MINMHPVIVEELAAISVVLEGLKDKLFE